VTVLAGNVTVAVTDTVTGGSVLVMVLAGWVTYTVMAEGVTVTVLPGWVYVLVTVTGAQELECQSFQPWD